ncbi:MAG TPA: nucleotidyltransferase family protein [Pyrinomonadaceae bacterium]|nr:nucleotidyltransferase family protein [Pyrinomonadaceae bacterium]
MVLTGKRGAKREAPSEAEVLLYCVSPLPEEERDHLQETLLDSKVDWDGLLRLALRHKVMPLLYRRLASLSPDLVPAPFMERLRDYFYLNAARNHSLTEELREVLRLFERNGIECIPYKGPALAIHLYGDVAYRQFSDLDIFIRLGDAKRASALLRERGYSREHELTKEQEADFLKTECQMMFVRERERIYLELHWGFVPTYFPLRLDSKSVWERLEPVSIGDAWRKSFSPEDLLLILCVNAGKDFWKELGQLCDVAGLIRAHPDLDWERIRREAARAKASRMLDVSLLLARDLLGANVPEKVANDMEARKGVSELASEVERTLFPGTGGRGNVSQYLAPARALDGLRDRARFHLRLALTPTFEDWTFIELPRPLRFLYYLTRPVRLARKYALRRKIHKD